MKKTQALVAILVVGSTLLFACWVVLRRSNDGMPRPPPPFRGSLPPAPVEKKEPSPPSPHLATYTDTRYGFQFPHPQNWTVLVDSELSRSDTLFLSFRNDLGVEIGSLYAKPGSVSDELQQRWRDHPPPLERLVNPNGIAITRPSIGLREYLFEHDGFVYSLSLSTFATSEDEGEAFEAVSQNFRFLSPLR